MIQTILQFRNADSTQDLNTQLAGFFKQGIVSGGVVLPVSPNSVPQVTVSPFKLIGQDGMVTLDSTDTETFTLPTNQTSLVCFQAKYVPNGPPIANWQVMELSAYNALNPSAQAILIIFASVVTTGPTVAPVVSYDLRAAIDPVGRNTLRGTVVSLTDLPASNQLLGDAYIVESGTPDPNNGLYVWKGTLQGWLNITDTLSIATNLAQHESNLIANEIHLTNAQADAALGTYGSPGTQSLTVTINIGTSVFSFAEPVIDNNWVVAAPIVFSTTGALPSGVLAGTTYYAIPVTSSTFKIATTSSNATSNIPVTLGGTQSGVQTAAFVGNAYVTSTDPRLPDADQSGALVGYSQVVPTPPSASNPFVTAAFNQGQPTDVVLTGVGAYITLSPSSGPFFVGLGVSNATILPYLGVFDPTKDREYVNSTGQGIILTGVYKDIIGPTPLNPSSESSVTNSNGFWSGTLYIAYTGTIDTNIRVRFGQQQGFQTVSRGLSVMNVAPYTSAENLERLQAISGLPFDTAMPAGATNVELAQEQASQYLYLNTITTADMIIPNSDFPHLRAIANAPPDFAANYGYLVQAITPTNAAYTVVWSNAGVIAFDGSYTADIPNLAVITYAGGTTLPAVLPGWTFVDDLGNQYRILEYKSSTLSLLIYTGGRSVNVNNAAGNQSQIMLSNNPRNLEILEQHQPSFFREFFPVDDIASIPGAFESLPPGGVYTGSYIPLNNYSLIGPSILPNQGNPNGAPRGRPYFNVVPFDTGNKPDPRLVLIGDWESDQANFPRQAAGNVTENSLGVEFTGRLTSITLWTSVNPDMAYGFQVFIDGAYSLAASEFLTNNQLNSLTPSNAWNALRGDMEKQMMPVHFGSLGITDSNLHTVRIEITQAGVTYFPLYGVSTYYSGAYESQGRGFTSTNYIKTATDNVVSSPIAEVTRGLRTVRYLDRTLQTRQTVTTSMPAVFSLTTNCTAIATTIADATLAANALMGDIYLFTTRAVIQGDATNWCYRRIVGIDRNAGTITIDSATGFAMPTSGVSRVELVFRVPTAPNGSLVMGSAQDATSTEYARFALADWSVGEGRDVSNLGTTLPDSRVTVLDDGSTSLAVVACRQVPTGIEGFANGVRFETTTSQMIINGWGTRLDLIFTGSGGTPSTIQIEVDGLYVYQVTVPNDGLISHSCFYAGSPQSHTVRVYNPSVAATVVVSQWIFHTIAQPVINGAALYEFETPRNSVAGTPGYYDFAPSTLTNPNVVSNAGVRLFDITKYGAKLYDGTVGSVLWNVTQDFVNNPRFGYTSSTDYTNGFMDLQFVGPLCEVSFLAGPGQGITQVFIDGVVASSSNFPGQIFCQGYNASNGQVDMYAASSQVLRFIVCGLAQKTHLLRMQVTGTANGLSTGNMLTVISAAENAGTNVVNRRSGDDTQINRLHMMSFRDLRQFLSLTPSQIGVVAGIGGETTSAPSIAGYLNSAYAMSDGSTSQNCTVSVVGGVTVIDINWAWVFGVNPGTTVGDLEVIIDGDTIPRDVTGVTVDSRYTEDLVVTGRINLWSNLSILPTPVSIDIRRKAGTVDTSSTNSGRIATQSGVVLGSVIQVDAGLADYSTWAAALAATAVGGKITVLSGFTSTETVVLSQRVFIEGAGYDSALVGTFTITGAVQFATIRSINVSLFVLDSGASGNIIDSCFWSGAPTGPGVGANNISGVLV